MENNLPILLIGACIVGLTAVAFRYLSAPRPVFLTPGSSEFVPIKLVRKTEISPDTRVWRFALEHPDQILGLPIGQHMTLRASINGEVVTRSYTPISSDAERGYVEFVVKVYFRNQNPRFPDGGKMSQHLESLKIGDTIDVKGPIGRFEYRGKGEFRLKAGASSVTTRRVKRMGLIAGGTGITPMLQIIRAVLKDKEDRTEMWLLFANQTEADILMRAELEECAKDPRFRFWHTLSRHTDDSGSGREWKYSRGHVCEEMFRAHMPPPDEHSVIFMCGPSGMVTSACKPNLEKIGFAPHQLVVF